jgi:endonuclease V-like protein UPF0215 family
MDSWIFIPGISSGVKNWTSVDSLLTESEPPVIVVGEHVARIRIDTHDPLYPDIESGFFAHFPDSGFREGLSDIHRAAGERPVTGIAAALEKNTAVSVRHYGRRSHYERIRSRRGRVVIKINTPHC